MKTIQVKYKYNNEIYIHSPWGLRFGTLRRLNHLNRWKEMPVKNLFIYALHRKSVGTEAPPGLDCVIPAGSPVGFEGIKEFG